MEPASHIWSDGELIPWEDATVHFLSHALHYGTGVFEGIRAYKTPEGPAVFRLNEHMLRLEASALAYGIPMRWSVEEMNEACRELLRATGLESAYIRPLVFYDIGTIGLDPSSNHVSTMMAAFEFGAYLGEEGINNGITAMVSTWRRISHTSLIPTAKGSGGYLNSVLAKMEASRNGYDEAIMLNEAGSISEGSGMNLFTVSDGVVFTPPVSSGILEGLTRNSVIELLTDEGVEVREVELARGSIYTADEMFLTGTAAEVTPIREVDGRPVGPGKPGPITRKAQDLFGSAVMGKLDAYRHWLDFV
ncbi:MAG: branched-chain amino acid transaminase [Actinomycetota bacterium]|nr:branched-chain amino acid transaminase [Actinomycetota bacterium]